MAYSLLELYNQSLSSSGKSILLYLDAKHQLHNSINGYEWQHKGKQHTKTVNSNTGRRRLNILGALNPVTFDLTSIVTECNCDKELLIVLLEEIKKDYPSSEKITIVLDNASYNRSYDVQDLAEDLGIELIYLPPYCPNLSLIERLWKYFIKVVISNHYYSNYDDFFEKVIDFLICYYEIDLLEISPLKNHISIYYKKYITIVKFFFHKLHIFEKN